MDYLQSLFDHTNIPVISALLLGLMTAISPCPLATNITATAYIAKNISSTKKILLSGFVYSLGRAFSYTTIGVALFFGANKFSIARFFHQYGERYLGPLLIVLGLIMLNIIKFNFFNKSGFTETLTKRFKFEGLSGSFLLGMIFALAFCPYSGAIFFGMLIPITITSAKGLYLPVIFALGTGIPVVLFTYFLAFTTGKIGILYNKITQIERIMRIIAGVVFVLVGIYYILIFTTG